MRVRGFVATRRPRALVAEVRVVLGTVHGALPWRPAALEAVRSGSQGVTRWDDLLLAPTPTRAVPAQPPTLSVLVPAYNAAGTTGDALESASVQRPPPLEVVVSEDGSEGDLDRALTGFGDRIRVVRGPNRGLPTARNPFRFGLSSQDLAEAVLGVRDPLYPLIVGARVHVPA
nr:glycosyltransferase family A protein [Geodermatophilus normandii]